MFKDELGTKLMNNGEKNVYIYIQRERESLAIVVCLHKSKRIYTCIYYICAFVSNQGEKRGGTVNPV